MAEFTGTGFLLRPYGDEDPEQVARVLNNVEVWRNLGASMPHPYTVENARMWIAKCRETTPGALQLTVDIGGRYSGGVNFRPVPVWSPHTFEIGYWLDQPHWGRGIATEIVAMLTTHAFEQCGAERMQGHVYSWNPASRRVLEKDRYMLEGRLRRAAHKNGEWGDVLAFGRLR